VRKYAKISLLLMASASTAIGQGTVLWNESVNGELSRDFSNPTTLASLQVGTNSVIGMTENVPTGGNWSSYPDYFTITIPGGVSVSGVYLSINKPNVWTWIGDSTYANQLGWAKNPSSGDLLPQWGLTSIGPGVTACT
jgi:hypothetical protein